MAEYVQLFEICLKFRFVFYAERFRFQLRTQELVPLSILYILLQIFVLILRVLIQRWNKTLKK